MSNIKATVIADSINTEGKRITTFEVEFPRFLLPEFNTHRMLSRNFSSDRAVPVLKAIEYMEANPAMPVYWGKNKAGMSASEELQGDELMSAKVYWGEAMDAAIQYVKALQELGLHKQLTNRILGPWQMMKGVVTATEWENFFWLRDHRDSQPEIQALARSMKEVRENSTPVELRTGDWHLPYFENGYWKLGNSTPLEEAQMISVSCCAQVSYRKNDTSLEKAKDIFKKLMAGERPHGSPFEHCATPLTNIKQPGVTHVDVSGSAWSGNFQGWVQYRQMIPNHYKKG